ncbi:MAG: hypothetical protein SGI77_19565 [Pirellulaceae bacterium]|nr:hypothetical protein [Pirellulaceae bacterium]
MTIEVVYSLVVTFVSGWILYAIMQFFVGIPGSVMASRFQSLGDLSGKHLHEIVRVVGKPVSVSSTGDGQLIQWMATGYHISLIFQNDLCQGISHEYSATELNPTQASSPSIESPPQSTKFPTESVSFEPLCSEDEEEAKSFFDQAKLYLKDGQREFAIDMLREIVRRYPSSKYAASAKRSLGALK